MIEFQLDYAYKHYQEISELEQKVFANSLKPIYKSDQEIKALMLFDNNQLIGFVTCKKDGKLVDIYNLAIDDQYRRLGYGTDLISKLSEFDCSLEVRSSNQSAIAFYENNGFVKSHVRKNYYNHEDGIVFTKPRSIKERAYAKINLVLNVLKKRDDGYHEIEFLMDSVNLYDDVEVVKSDTDGVCVVGNEKLSNLDNLAYKALELLRDKYKFSTKYKITIKKNIPVAAGMAGGSSDAAAVLRAINQLEGLEIPLPKLAMLGSFIGSDVSYCVYSKLAIARGRGEQIELSSTKLPFAHILVINPGVELSTPTVYKNHVIGDTHGDINKLLEADNFDMFCNYLSNDLEKTAKTICSEIIKLEQELREYTSERIMVSGSGPTLLVFSQDKKHIEFLQEKFKTKYDHVYACELGK